MDDPVDGGRRKVTAAAITAVVSFTLVLAAIEAMALRGQVDFGRHVLHLKDAWLAVPPIALEGGTLASATLTLWAVLTRDSATLPRLMTAALLAAAAYANYEGAHHAGRLTLAADYLAGASVAAYLMWHTVLTRVRRGELRSAGAVDPPLPRFRLLRWIFAFSQTRAAFTIAVREGISDPREALARIGPDVLPPAQYTAEEIGPDELAALAAERGGKRRAVEYAATVLGCREPSKVQQWLASHGIHVDLSYVSRTLRPRELNAPQD